MINSTPKIPENKLASIQISIGGLKPTITRYNFGSARILESTLLPLDDYQTFDILKGFSQCILTGSFR
jgi:hypothetical protein